jgi:hypothetical protein
MKRLLLALALLCAPLLPAAAHAQQAAVVTSCGGLTYATGQDRPVTQDTTGNLCTAATASGTSSTVAQGSTTSGQSGTLIQGAVTTTPPAYTTAKTNPLSLSLVGGLRIEPAIVDATITGSPPPSLMMGGWLASSGASQAIRMGAVGSFRVSPADPYPYDSSSARAVPLTGASGNVANASAAASLAANASTTDYVSGFQCTAAGSTAALVVNATLAGVITGTQTYTFVFPAGVTAQATPLVVAFNPPVPASAVNTAITITLPAGGAGNTNAACNIQGYRY